MTEQDNNTLNDRIDHAAEAQALLIEAGSEVSENMVVTTGEHKADVIAHAQVHATLALVEQQRIANRLQVAAIDQMTTMAQMAAPQGYPVDPGIRLRDYLTAADWEQIEVVSS